MKSKICFLILLLTISLILLACQEEPDSFSRLEKLIIDVFDPQPGEKVLIMTDLPHGGLNDYELWSDRRLMAEEWQASFAGMEDELELSVYPLLTYPATGSHNGPLPETGTVDGQEALFEEVLADTNIVVALTEFSATAPLVGYTEKYSNLRAASMPGATRAMENTALAADYAEMAPKCEMLAEHLNRAEGANLTFSTGDELFIDLRFRRAHVDDGQLHANKHGDRVINLPSGEAYMAPYEGEMPGQISKTAGIVPLPVANGSFVQVRLEENRVVEVLGEGPEVEDLRFDFSIDDGRRNLAELGLGCNDMAVITGNVLEDEKVFGVHLAGGLSEHIGGTVDVDDFLDPGAAEHTDVVFPFGGDIEITTLVLEYEDGTSGEIIKDSRYVIFDDLTN